MKTLLVLGHSFVRYVADNIDQDGLDLGDDIDHIAVQCIGGPRVSGVYRQLSYVRRIKPYVIFLDIGTNDPSDPQKQGRSLWPSVRTITISVMRRADGRRHNFNHERVILNDKLKRFAISYDHIYNMQSPRVRHKVEGPSATRWCTSKCEMLYLKNMRYAVRKSSLKEKIQLKQGIAKLWWNCPLLCA